MAEVDPRDNRNYAVVNNYWEMFCKAKAKVTGQLFEKTYGVQSEPVEVWQNLFKINLVPGSDDSIDFLNLLQSAESEANDESLNGDTIASDIYISKFV